MGFFGILKRKETKLDENLDIPPALPPGLDTEEEKVVEAISEEEFPRDIGKTKAKKKVELPPIPSLEKEFPEDIKEVPRIKEEILPPPPEIKEGLPELPTLPEEGAITEPSYALEAPIEKKIRVKPKAITKPLFINMVAFRNILYDIKTIRSNLKELKDSLDKEESDILYRRFRSSLNDIQRKLRFVDKNLFKG